MMNEIGALIRSSRKARSQSQADLAHLLGMSRATISAIENGSIGEIGIRKVIALCETLGLELYAGPKRSRPTLREVLRERRDGKRHA